MIFRQSVLTAEQFTAELALERHCDAFPAFIAGAAYGACGRLYSRLEVMTKAGQITPNWSLSRFLPKNHVGKRQNKQPRNYISQKYPVHSPIMVVVIERFSTFLSFWMRNSFSLSRFSTSSFIRMS